MKRMLLLVAAALCACSSTDDEGLLKPKNSAGSAGSAQAGASAAGSAGEGQGGSSSAGGTAAGGSGTAGGGTSTGGVGGFNTGDSCVDLCKLYAACLQVSDSYCELNCGHIKQMAGSCYGAYAAVAACVADDIGSDCKRSSDTICDPESAKLKEACGNDCGVKFGTTMGGGTNGCTASTECGSTSLKVSCEGKTCTCERNGTQVGTCEPSSSEEQSPCSLDSGCCAQFFF